MPHAHAQQAWDKGGLVRAVKSPAFQFYVGDYLGSQRVQMMTLEEEGAYVRLLCSCWQHGSVPKDPKLAARIIGKGASTTLATKVLEMFIPSSEPGKMVHDRLEREREKQRAWREKSSEGGRKSAQIRNNHSNGGSTTLQPASLNHTTNQRSTLPLSSPSSSSKESTYSCLEDVNGWTPPIPKFTPSQLSYASDLMDAMKPRLNLLFNRKPNDPWRGEEERLLAGISRRPNCIEELGVVETAAPDWGRFGPQSLRSLLEGWTDALDRARKPNNHNPDSKSKPTILDRTADALLKEAQSL